MTPYAKISRALLRRKDLVPAAKLILTVLDDLPPQKDHRKRASLHYLASETGQSRNTVKRVLAALSKASMVVVESQPGRRHGFLVTVVDDDGENRAQNGPGPPGPKWADTRPRMGRPPAQNGPPARASFLNNPLKHTCGVPPLVFERARSRLETAYQEVFGAGSAPPASWLKKLGEELAAGAGLVDELDAAAIRGGLEMAKDNRRPFGLGWVILFVQKRQLERRDAQERAEKNPKPETRNSKLENEDLALRMREFFERLPEDRRREYEAAALAQKFVRPGTALHRAMAAQMAWGERPEIPVAREGE